MAGRQETGKEINETQQEQHKFTCTFTWKFRQKKSWNVKTGERTDLK